MTAFDPQLVWILPVVGLVIFQLFLASMEYLCGLLQCCRPG